MTTQLSNPTSSTWIDEDGKQVDIFPFFSVLYTDDIVNKLNQKYSCSGYSCHQVLSSMGRAELEYIAIKILSLSKLHRGWRGVAKDELIKVLKRDNEHFYLHDFIERGYLREKKVMGTVVVFPTEKLLQNQRVPTR